MDDPLEPDTVQSELKILRSGVISWWRTQEFNFPWRTREGSEWEALVTEVLLQRTRANAVKELYREFFKKYSSIERLHDASEGEIRDDISSLGLHWRAEYLSSLGTELSERGGRVPEDRADIEDLPGIGQYAAGAFLTFQRHRRVTFIDANIVKLLGRFLGFEWDGETRRKAWFVDLADAFFDHDYPPAKFGYAVLDFTREVCGRTPECESCPVQKDCAFP